MWGARFSKIDLGTVPLNEGFSFTCYTRLRLFCPPTYFRKRGIDFCEIWPLNRIGGVLFLVQRRKGDMQRASRIEFAVRLVGLK